MIAKKYILIVFLLVISGCAGITQPIKIKQSDVITEDVYFSDKSENGVVLLDINWGRCWGCGGYENAQLVSLAFDKFPMSIINNEVEPALVLHSPSRLFVNSIF